MLSCVKFYPHDYCSCVCKQTPAVSAFKQLNSRAADALNRS